MIDVKRLIDYQDMPEVCEFIYDYNYKSQLDKMDGEMDMKIDHVSNIPIDENESYIEGRYYIQRWVDAKLRLEKVKSELNNAECEVLNSEKDLAKWIAPQDMKIGEKICIWYGDSLIQVELCSGYTYKVSIRERGKSL